MPGLVIERDVVIEAPVEVVWRTITEPDQMSHSQLVEFTLTPEGEERTRLRVTESGHELRDWPETEKQRYAGEHQDGWGEYLDRLADVLAGR